MWGILNNTAIHKTIHKAFFFHSVDYTQQVFLFHKLTIKTGNCGQSLLLSLSAFLRLLQIGARPLQNFIKKQ